MFHLLIPAALTIALTAVPVAAQEPARGPLDALQNVFGLALDPRNEGRVLLATEYGLLRAAPDGFAEALPQVPMAVVGLTGLPDRPDALILSGFGEDGAPGGLMVSSDGGQTWAPIPGTAGKDGIAVTSLSVSPGNPKEMVALAQEIMLSADGGASWRPAGKTPPDTLTVAASAMQAGRIYAGTMSGLMVSDDGGATWAETAVTGAPVTAVAPLGSGRMAAFVYGRGLLVANEATPDWKPTGADFQDRYLRAMTEAPDGTIYAVADTGAILLGRDGGRRWVAFEGSDLATPERIAAGKALYADTCQACHGVGGIGESPDDPTARDAFGFKAPALNDDMHAWHHSDAGLRETIHKGSPRNPRMIAWEEQLSDDEIDSILAYIKSTWSIRSLACQGGRHMACMGR